MSIKNRNKSNTDISHTPELNSIPKTNSENLSSFKSVRAHAAGEITEKKSRFIGDVFPVRTEEEAKGFIREISKIHYDTRHHCFAFVCGDLMRSSDDGEPSGTAGKPILDVITGEGLSDTLIVVTRYFGGILLGTGGLSRAYTAAAKAALGAAELVTYKPFISFEVSIDYSLTGAFEYYLRAKEIDKGTPEYTDGVLYRLSVPTERAEKIH